jgi:hypothetical protein
MNGSTDVNETRVSCVDYTELCLYKEDLFSFVDSIYINIFFM